MDSYTLFGRGKGLIQIVQELLYEISVFGDVPGLYPLYFHCMINCCSTFISFWQKILNLTVFGFLALDGFQFLGFFSNIDQQKNASRDIIFLGCVHHGQDLVLKCATSVSLMRTGEVTNTLNSVLGVSDYSLYTVQQVLSQELGTVSNALFLVCYNVHPFF